jgi:hypothetical protein
MQIIDLGNSLAFQHSSNTSVTVSRLFATLTWMGRSTLRAVCFRSIIRATIGGSRQYSSAPYVMGVLSSSSVHHNDRGREEGWMSQVCFRYLKSQIHLVKRLRDEYEQHYLTTSHKIVRKQTARDATLLGYSKSLHRGRQARISYGVIHAKAAARAL